MRVALTGAAGFLGSHLADRLIQEGHEVIGLDNFVTGDEANIAHLLDSGAFRLIRQDVSTYIDIPESLDYVLHFASPASPNPASPFGYPNLPIQTLKAGALGTLNTLGLAKALGATATRLVPVRYTTKPNVLLKRSQWHICAFIT